MKCPACKSEIPDGADFCPICGNRIKQQNSMDGTACPVCGEKNETDADFCISCGSNLSTGASAPGSSPGGNRKRILLLVIGVLLIAGIVGSLWFVHERNQKEQEKNHGGSSGKETVQPAGEMQQIDRQKHESLQESLASYIEENGVNDTVSVYYKDLSDGEEFELGSRSMRAGQIGRIFVMEYIMEQIYEGNIEDTPELANTIDTTLTGDEPSSRRLVELITGDFADGLSRVSDFVRERGYIHTQINRFNGDPGRSPQTTPNQTSAWDIGKCMAVLYENAQEGDVFAQNLMDSMQRICLKTGMAEGAADFQSPGEVINFTASYIECENETAVITCGGKSVVIGAMITELVDDEQMHEKALENLQEISRMICEALLRES